MAKPEPSDDIIRSAMDAYTRLGSQTKAANELGVSQATVCNYLVKARERGYSPEHDMNNIAPDGFLTKGTSTLYDKDGNVKIQWVKTTRDAQQRHEALRAAIEAMSDDIPRAEPIKEPLETLDDLLACYPVGDHHFGMLAWHEETGGDDYDIKIAENDLCKAMSYLVDTSPKTNEAAILILGDFLHYDSMLPITPASKHILDADSRFPQVVRAAMRSIRFLVSEALNKHRKVRLVLEIGNHDPSSTIMMMEMFYMFFENEPRVVVDRSPRNCHVFQFGNNLIGTHHGDKIKTDKLPLVIATDWHKIWGNTEHRVIHTGHVHHDHKKEHPGMFTESHGILAPKDAYAANGGWRARQSMKLIVYHKQHGEVGRNIVTPEMIK